jgi:hypothetical protein
MTTVIRVAAPFTIILAIGRYSGHEHHDCVAGTRDGTPARGISAQPDRGRFSPSTGAVGGVIGRLLALPVHGILTGTTNMASFSEVAFKFRITPAWGAVCCSPRWCDAARPGAARIPIARALREI